MREGHVQLGRKEQRVIAEAPSPARLGQDESIARGLDDFGYTAGRGQKRHDTAVARRALVLGDTRQLLEQQRVVLNIPTTGRPAGRARTRRAAERVDFDPRIIRNGGQAAPHRVVAGLGDRVLHIAHAALQVGFFRKRLEQTVGGKGHLERQAGEQLADLTRLAGAARANEELHPPRKRSSSPVVDWSLTSGTRTTRPPQPSTSVAPTIASRA